jgi:hypothetical protein
MGDRLTLITAHDHEASSPVDQALLTIMAPIHRFKDHGSMKVRKSWPYLDWLMD